MDVNLGYAAWLTETENKNSTLKLTFDDGSSVLFSLAEHTTRIDTTADIDQQEPCID